MVIGNNKKPVCIIADKIQIIELKKKGIERSRFFRQACDAYFAGKFEYKFIDEDE